MDNTLVLAGLPVLYIEKKALKEHLLNFMIRSKVIKS
jgi:hypothetical protein